MSDAIVSPLPDAVAGEEEETIRIRGARVHNLRDVTVDIPRGKLTVITGPSGSGKSSLAFDTLHAEGQRRYIESLSTFARQFFDQLERPDVDAVDGLQPTLAIDQRTARPHPRSTVGTITEIHDFLRLLYARLGLPHCLECGKPIERQPPEAMAAELLALPPQSRLMLLAPLWTQGQGNPAEAFEKLRKSGFVRARIDGTLHDLEQVAALDRKNLTRIEAVVDRLIVRDGIGLRLAESIRTVLKHGEGTLIALHQPPEDRSNNWQERQFTTHFACIPCGRQLAPLEPRNFSFNSPYGACPTCDGLGRVERFDPDLVFPEPHRGLADGAILPWRGTAAAARKNLETVLAWAKSQGQAVDVPWASWPESARRSLLFGEGTFPGVANLLEAEFATAKGEAAREKLAALRGDIACLDCGGARLRPESRGVLLAGRPFHAVTGLPIEECLTFFRGLSFTGPAAAVAEPLVREIAARLAFLLQVGLDYLTLDRTADTLSGGESQRIRLARGIGSGLLGVCYVLDEPSIGLHPRDNDRLNAALRNLQTQGNTVVVVEHDEAVMRQADRLIDIGPGAGVHGGQVVACGTVAEVSAHPTSVTGMYLSGRRTMPRRLVRRTPDPRKRLVLEGATSHNLRDVTLDIPLGLMTAVTGVSGSGKSSLLHGTLARALTRHFHQAGPRPGPCRGLFGTEHIDRFIEVDQAGLGRSARSNPATYTGLFDEIRKVFATTKEAKTRGWKAARFSFNAPGGRCETCQGHGRQKVEMHFLPDFDVPCPSCRGKRFNRATLEVRFKGLSIADSLELRIDAAREVFANIPALVRPLDLLLEVGLGYLTLGQSADTLSGGEAQRIKLATELARSAGEHTLYLLDEPTTGLHFEDVRNLLLLLERLTEQGHTVVTVEHHLDLIRAADWVIDLGPGGGRHGGSIVAVGPPEAIAACPESLTGKYLVS